MKTILAALVLVAAVGCSNLREVQQVDIVEVRVVKIDTVFRHPEHLKQLTWKDTDDIQYISYVPIYNKLYDLGSSIYVIKRR